jgi:hypothetical protein
MRKPYLVALLLFASYHSSLFAYESSYDRIQWDKRGDDTFYCIDITDDKFQVNPWLQALFCGENLYSFSPKDYLNQMQRSNSLAAGTRFGWRVWSPSGYGGHGYEGIVTVQSCVGQPYLSSSALLQWGCRGNDSFYCIDILDTRDNFVKQRAMCGEGLHQFFPASLDLAAADYRWKVWSNSGYGGWAQFEGQFTVTKPVITPPTTEPTPTPDVPEVPVTTPTAKYSCRGKTWCDEMTSCEEALFYLRNCPNTRIDGDKDGIPCEEEFCGH